MELSSLFNALDGAWIDDLILWSVVAVAGTAGLAVIVNALDVFFDAG